MPEVATAEPAAAAAPKVRPVLEVRDLAVHYRVPVNRSTHSLIPQNLPGVARALYDAVTPRFDATIRAVDGVDLHIMPGEILGLVGESGCGKSSTGRALVRLERTARGKITVDGIRLDRAGWRERRRLRRVIQMVFQDPYGSLDPRMTVGQIIAEPLRVLDVAPRARDRAARVAVLLEQCGIDPRLADRLPHEFSGGQRQRIAIARAIAPEPKLVVADEPVSALDVSIQAQILNLLLELQRRFNLSMLFIAHDLAVVRQVSQRIAVMYLGKIVEVAPSEKLYREPIHPYSRALVSAVPIPDPLVERVRPRIVLEGEVPSPLRPPRGCRFHPRCKDATDRCRIESPLLKIGGLDRPVACHVAHGEG